MNGGNIPVFRTFSPETTSISHLFILVLIINGIILAIVIGMIGYGLIFFRHKLGSADPTPHFGNRKLEITWTVGPILIITWLFVLTVYGMRQSDPAANRQPDLIVTGHQWWWEVRYPQSGVVTANEIHIPVGQQWLVRLESADVIHNFWVPELARKIQAIPGQTNQIWLEANAPGTFAGECAEYCGAEHSWMRFSVIAESSTSFDGWLRKQENPATNSTISSAQDGLKIFQTMTCANCHSIRGISAAANAGPDLTHLADRKILGGGVLPNTETNLFRWLKDPQAIKPGCLMPDLKLTDTQAGALASYLETLK
jgi:cytochrome c oxidase subunit II